MKIKYIKGNLLDAKGLVLHGCNAQGAMNSGVAKVLRDAYPDVFTEYKKVFIENGNEFALGDIVPVLIKNRLIVINAITQKYYGYDKKKYVSYDAISEVMRKMNKSFQTYDSISMPMIGSDRGGGNWNIIEKIIEEELTDKQPIVYQL